LSTQSVRSWRLICQPYLPTEPYPRKHFPVLISVRSAVNPGAIVRLERLGTSKKNKKNQCLCRIGGSHSGSYESYHIRDTAPYSPYMIQHFEGTYQLNFQGRELDGHLLTCWFLFRLIFGLKIELIQCTFLYNADLCADYKVLYPRRWQLSVCA
jgi:hypothetical protein